MKRSPLKPGAMPRRKTPMPKVSAKRARALATGKRAAKATDYLDRERIAFSQHHLFTGGGGAPRLVKNPALLAWMHEEFAFCFNCETRGAGLNSIQAHHIEAGFGRSDVRCNIAMFCAECHSNVKTDKLPHGGIYYLKWLHDPDGTDWCLLARLRGVARLPGLITDR